MTAERRCAPRSTPTAIRSRSSRSSRRAARRTPASSTSSRASEQLARERELWFHVDAAYGGAAMLGRLRRELFTGLRHADSFIVDPHKWLFAPLDCCALIYREPAARADDAHPARELPRRAARRRRRGRGRVEPL